MSTPPTRNLASWGLLANCCAVFMTVMDCLIVNVALASMTRALGAELSHLQWVVDAYTLSFASCLLLAGPLGDRLGYRHLFSVGLWIFTLAFLVCFAYYGFVFLGLFLASSMGADTPRFWLAVMMLPIGLGSSLGISPALMSMLLAIPKGDSGVAAGLFNTGRQVGALLGVAVLGAFLGSEAHFLQGFHAALLLSSALMLLCILGTLRWAQKAPGQEILLVEGELASEV